MQKEFHISAPIVKIDEDQRIIYAYATTEDVDKQGEIVDYDASKKAFGSWVKQLGNIREMHQPKVVGKAFDATYEDDSRRVLLGLKLSESTDGKDAWTKVKEGLFTGLSIGGKVKTVIQEAVKGTTDIVNRITDYELAEVSLVDNPANPAAQFVMVKSIDGKPQPVEVFERFNDQHSEEWWSKAYAYSPEQVTPAESKTAPSTVTVPGWAKAFHITPEQQLHKVTKESTMSDQITKGKTDDVAAQGEHENQDDDATKESTPAVSEAGETVSADPKLPEDAPANGPVTPEDNGDHQQPVSVEPEKPQQQVIEAAPGTVPKGAVSEDLVKAIGTAIAGEMTKLATSQSDDLTKAISKLDEAVNEISSLKDRMSKLEELPLAIKAKASYHDVEKGSEQSEEDTLKSELADIMLKSEEWEKNPSLATGKERADAMDRMRVLKRQLAAHTN